MNSFLSSINTTYTENGALTLASSGSKVMDLFAMGGALRSRDESDIQSIFGDAFNEDALLATKIAFYLRDVRGGQGERKTFRAITDWMAVYAPDVLVKNLPNIAFFGRWDDLIRLVDCGNDEVASVALGIIRNQLNDDIASEHPSLLAKWMPSVNTGSKATRDLAKMICSKLDMRQSAYRKTLSSLRRKIKLVESLMCAQEWNGINYENVPSRAAMNYRNAFKKHDATRYEEYLGAVEKGEKVIKASTLYPYDIVEKFMGYGSAQDRTLEAQWNALPDYLAENPDGKGIVVADVSGSMMGRPMAVSISLAMYMAERNVGPFKDAFITFSARPQLQMVKGNSLYEKVQNLMRANWDMNTNIEAVFDLILTRAQSASVPVDDMPNTIYIISDMEFDACSQGNRTNFEVIKDKYASAGYVMPRLVFWNVNSRNTQSPVSVNEKGVMLVSGCSPVIFEQVIKAKTVTPYDLMLETINAPRYDAVTV